MSKMNDMNEYDMTLVKVKWNYMKLQELTWSLNVVKWCKMLRIARKV